MLKVLVANDDKKVLNKICDTLALLDIKIIKAVSYQETIKVIFEEDLDKIILDMTMPTYQIQKNDDGGTFRKSAGIEILSRMKLYCKEVDVLLLTRLEQFYDSFDIKKNDFYSIQNDVNSNKWQFCKGIIKYKDELDLEWKDKIIDFVKE